MPTPYCPLNQPSSCSIPARRWHATGAYKKRTRWLCYRQHNQLQCKASGASGAGGGSGRWGRQGRTGQQPEPHRPSFKERMPLVLAALGSGIAFYQLCSQLEQGHLEDTSTASLSIIVPALNEEKCIADTLRYLQQLNPPAKEVIVVDGGSSDRTLQLAAAAGATVISSSERGRARQMNVGAEVASGDLLCFLHADTLPPVDLVDVVRQEFADPNTCLTGFKASIEVPERKLWFMTAHHLLKSYYLPLIFTPHKFLTGLRVLFGDQVLCCRARDFRAVGGYRPELPIMEDADLCLRMHAQGPAAAGGPGRIKQILGREVVTSGRRLAAWGNIRGTYIHFVIGLKWYLGAEPEELVHLYRTMYTDNYR